MIGSCGWVVYFWNGEKCDVRIFAACFVPPYEIRQGKQVTSYHIMKLIIYLASHTGQAGPFEKVFFSWGGRMLVRGFGWRTTAEHKRRVITCTKVLCGVENNSNVESSVVRSKNRRRDSFFRIRENVPEAIILVVKGKEVQCGETFVWAIFHNRIKMLPICMHACTFHCSKLGFKLKHNNILVCGMKEYF